MCPVIWDIQNNQIHRDTLYITGYKGLGKGKRGHIVCWIQNFSWEDENYGDGWWWFYSNGYTTNMHVLQFSSVQLLSHVRLFVTPCTAARQASLSITNSWKLLRVMSIKLVMSSNHLILPPLNFSQYQVENKQSVLCIRWPKYWSFSFSISPAVSIWG